MPSSKRPTNVKKIALKSESKKVVRFDVNEAIDISKKAVEAMNVTGIDLKKLLDSFDIETVSKIDHYFRHDKSTIPVKIEKVGMFAPDLVKIASFRDYLSNVIDKPSDIIHDAIVSSCSDSDDTFNFENFKGMISELRGKKRANSMAD